MSEFVIKTFPQDVTLPSGTKLIQQRIANYLILDIDAYTFLTIPNSIDIVDEFCATHGLKRMGGIMIEGSVNRDYFQIKTPIEGWKETVPKEDTINEFVITTNPQKIKLASGMEFTYHREGKYLLLDNDKSEFMVYLDRSDIVDEFCTQRGLKPMGKIHFAYLNNDTIFRLRVQIEGWEETVTMQEPSKEDIIREELDNIVESLRRIQERL